MITSCSSDDEDNSTAWDESVKGELSGDLLNPTSVNFQFGNNRIIGNIENQFLLQKILS